VTQTPTAQTAWLRIRPFLILFPALGLILGLALRLLGLAEWSGFVWAAFTLPVLLTLLIEIVSGLRRGDVGLDIVAALSMSAALIFGEELARSWLLCMRAVSISRSSGTAASAEAADAVILVDQLDRLLPAIGIARRSPFIARESVLAGIGSSVLGIIAAAFDYIIPVQGALLQELIDVAVILERASCARLMIHRPKKRRCRSVANPSQWVGRLQQAVGPTGERDEGIRCHGPQRRHGDPGHRGRGGDQAVHRA
jgi:cation transport ATPase